MWSLERLTELFDEFDCSSVSCKPTNFHNKQWSNTCVHDCILYAI